MTETPLTHAELLAQPADDYMNTAQQQFFRALLLTQRGELQTRIAEEFEGLRERETSSDPADIGSAEEQRQWQLRLLEREKNCSTKSTKPLSGWPVVNTGGAWRPVSQSASSACCYGPPRACASKPKSVRNNAKNTCATQNSDGA
ncbi:hypothetical protein SAMN05216370_1888 [Pseudomonas peli]|uniref:DnaK suppressor protein DksA N-terminal domain-containing protein n=1 Tax=Pseudomonas peli TaxID=592361 RepID=A0AB37Z6P9_9PSED|nr:hypothetical protein SAMN05216370_1888 [Pseudomonas peli]